MIDISKSFVSRSNEKTGKMAATFGLRHQAPPKVFAWILANTNVVEMVSKKSKRQHACL